MKIIKARTLSEVRLLLHKYQYEITKKSSCYFYAGHIYIGLSGLINIDEYNEFKPSNDAESLLSRWCYSELHDNHAFTQYEQSANCLKSLSEIIIDNQVITRCYHSLSEIMLIINITPDSFSDGGKYGDISYTLQQIKLALADGVMIFDIGAESTRPNAEFISSEDEIDRLMPIMQELSRLKLDHELKISLDSYKSETINYYLENIDIINDVSNKLPLELVKEVTKKNKKYVLMHSLTVPASPLTMVDTKLDVTAELLTWFQGKLDYYRENGVNLANVIIDPGIGFNKTQDQAWQLLREIDKFFQFGCEVLVGHSRKRFLDKVTTRDFALRDLESATVSQYLASKSIDYIRMHEYKDYMQINKIMNNLGDN